MEERFLSEYSPPQFVVPTLSLAFGLSSCGDVVVVSRARVERAAAEGTSPLVLDSHPSVRVLSVRVGRDEAEFCHADGDLLEVALPPAPAGRAFDVEVTAVVSPDANSELMGLYRSDGFLLSQCEPEGFRRVVPSVDRPDVLSRVDVTVVGSRDLHREMLSNGNLAGGGALDAPGDAAAMLRAMRAEPAPAAAPARTPDSEVDALVSLLRDGQPNAPPNSHWRRFEDPVPRPSYLFALVAGRLERASRPFVTAGGREVELSVYATAEHLPRCAHAMDALERSMRWDEERYGLEFAHDRNAIVAVSRFAFGAMENTTLMIFNAKYILATPETATDDDFTSVAAVVAHEQFHYHTGNRVTVRDFFQLSLKEGFTVFREQQFVADALGGGETKRVQDVALLRRTQFKEDSGAAAHPVRPESSDSVEALYSPSVYEKGAELVRMLHTLLGEARFRRGADLYFERHAGCAATVEDFVAAMADAAAPGSLLDARRAQWMRWYTQKGTPTVVARQRWRPEEGVFELELEQRQQGQPPLVVPIAFALLGHDGPARAGGDAEMVADGLVALTGSSGTLTWEGVRGARPVPSLNRGFSAPIRVEADLPAESLAALLAGDSDTYVRWDSGQQLMEAEALGRGDGRAAAEALRAVVTGAAESPAEAAQLLTFPAAAHVAEVAGRGGEVPVDPRATAVDTLRAKGRLAVALRGEMRAAADAAAAAAAAADADAASDRAKHLRALRNVLLGYDVAGAQVGGGVTEAAARAAAQFDASADNMTLRAAALHALCALGGEPAARALDAFLDAHRGDPLVLCKWLAAQATAPRDDAVDAVAALLEHAAFDGGTPNHVYAAVGGLCTANPVAFHRQDGAGYALVADEVLRLDSKNSQVAARLASGAFSDLIKWDEGTAGRALAHVERVAAGAGSANVRAAVGKVLRAQK